MSYPFPAGQDPKLEYWAKQLEGRLLSLEKSGEADDGTGADDNAGDATGFEPVDETPVVLAGVGETEDTEDAWTTIASGAPSGARWAIIQGYLFSDDDDSDCKLSARTDSGSPEIVRAIIHSDETDSEGQTRLPWWFQRLTEDGNFDYRADTTAGTSDWEVRRIGYVL